MEHQAIYPVNMKNMAKKGTIETTPTHGAPTAAPANASAWSPGLTVSNSVCLSVGQASDTPKLIHYRVVLFHTQDIGLIDL